jgi:hypothetical protein
MSATLEIKALEKSIKSFYANSFSVNNLNDSDYMRIDTPFCNRHNDQIILYAKKLKDTYILTDGAYILDDLETDGFYVKRSTKRRQILESQLKAYSVSVDFESNQLYVEFPNLDDYAMKQNLLIQAMLFVNDMFVMNDKNIVNIFKTDIEQFFEENNIRAVEDASFIGSSGMTHKFDFSIPGLKKKNIPERLIRTMNSPNNEYYAKAMATDIRLTRPIVNHEVKFYTFINDSKKDIDSRVISLFDSEGITSIPYSQRNNYVEELAE